MLITIILWSYFLFSFYILGSGFIVLSNRFWKMKPVLNWADTVILGFCLSLIFSLWISLFSPLNLSIQILYTIIVVVVTLLLIFTHNIHIGEIKPNRISISTILLLISFCLILVNTINRPMNADTGIYHAQTIRWIESYPVVPGLGNLHSRLAYNSSWLVVNALFSFHQIFSQSLHVLPGFLFFLISAGMITKLPDFIHERKLIPVIFGVLSLVLLFESNISQASSPGTDLPVILFVIYIIFLCLSWFDIHLENPIIVIFLSVLVIITMTIKLSVLPIGLVFIFLFGRSIYQKRFRLTGILILLSFMVFVPWFIRSFIMTGYLFYPIDFPNIFSVDWKIPAYALVTEQEVIRAFGRIPEMDYREVIKMPFSAWVKPWFYDFSFNRQFMILSGFSLPFFLNVYWIKPLRRFLTSDGIKSIFFVSGIVSIGLYYWLFSAPGIRFGYTFIIPACALSVSLAVYFFMWLIQNKVKRNLMLNGIIVVALLFVSQLLIRSVNYDNLRKQLIYPAPYPNLPTIPCEIFEKTILCSELYNECWYSPFPCVPKADPQVMMRGEDFREGFRRLK